MKKTLPIAVIGLLALGMVYAWQAGLFSSNVPDDSAAVSTSETDSKTTMASPAEGTEAAQETTSIEGISDVPSDESDGGQTKSAVEPTGMDDNSTSLSQSNPSPFEVINDGTESNQTPRAESAPTQEAPVAALQPKSNDSTGLRRGVIAVPESYPVTDAAKYFVPKEERAAGNLGGPPPLSFPGGPSDPNLAPAPPAPTPPAPGD